MEQSIAQLVASPDRYLHSFEGEFAQFVAMDPAAYRRSIFLDHRIQPAAGGLWQVPALALAAQAPARMPICWIFHVAHCGSTLLARALEALTADLVLREPLALRQLALEPDADRLRVALALLSRRYPGRGPTLVKANVPVNFILDSLAEADPLAPAVFLHCALPDYLLAILRSPTHRTWLRNVTGLLSRYLGELQSLEDAELAAALWMALQRRFAAAIARMPNARSLDAERFFGAPQATLEAVCTRFGMTAAPEAVQSVVTGALFSTYSKNPALAFDNSARLARRERLAKELDNELTLANRWLDRNAPDAGEIEAQLRAAALIA